MKSLVPDVLADRGVEQPIHREPLVAEVLRDGEPEIGQRVAERNTARGGIQ